MISIVNLLNEFIAIPFGRISPLAKNSIVAVNANDPSLDKKTSTADNQEIEKQQNRRIQSNQIRAKVNKIPHGFKGDVLGVKK